MSSTLSWLHLSDFHVGKDDYGQLQLFDQLLSHIGARSSNGAVPDLVFVSGDLANRGRKQEYLKLSDEFFLPLVEVLGSKPRFYVVPGNHDVDRSQARILQFPEIVRKNPRMLDPSAEGLADRRTLIPRFSNFIEGDLFNLGVGHWIQSEAGSFTDRFNVATNSVCVIGINTAWASHGNEDRHRLSPGKGILENALKTANGCDLKLLVGHHPLDWFVDEEVEPIGALMAREGAIYLHGHLHRARSKFENYGSGTFLALQAGAAFQARENDEWINRIMWVEADFAQREIRIEPLQWSRRNQEWAVDASSLHSKLRRAGSNFWVVPMPEEQTITHRKIPSDIPSKSINASPGAGWVELEPDLLGKILAAPLDKARILAYFDGRNPSWVEALHCAVPRREIVRDLISAIEGDASDGRASVSLLLGAGGEGKSTAIRQVAGELASARTGWRVLWHDDADAPLKIDYIRSLKRENHIRTLIVSDDAELIANDVYKIVKCLHESGRRDVHFLLSARDTDWLSVEADQLPWALYVGFRPVRVRGLSLLDARLIVQAWSQLGQEGLGRLAGITLDEAALKLVQESLSEQSSEGAFLGAMLRARLGEELKGHVTSLLHRLKQRSCPMGTLADAFAYIAALHSENFLVLNKDVLAAVLGYKSTTELRRFVLTPLGEEAAVGSLGGTCILTRHRAIADTAVELLSSFVDFDEIFIDLGLAAVQVKVEGKIVPHLDRYEYLSTHFQEKGNTERSVRIAHALAKRYPHNKHYLTKLANLYREAGEPDRAATLFRRTPEKCERDRAFYHEWAACELAIGKHAIAAYLYWICLSDSGGYEPVRNDRCRSGLIGIARALHDLAEQVNDSRIPAGADCAAYLCRRLKLDAGSKARLEQVQPRIPASDIPTQFGNSMALTTLAAAAQAAWDNKESAFPEWVLEPSRILVRSLAGLLGCTPPAKLFGAR